MEGKRHYWLISFLVLVTSCMAIDDTHCPRQCDCSYMMRDLTRELEITCFIDHVDAFDYGALMNVAEPYALRVFCDSAVPSQLTNSMFAALHSCDVISFHKCKFSYVHRYAFNGLRNLRKIDIEEASSVHLELHPLVFQSIDDVASVAVTRSGVVKIPDLCSLEGLNLLNLSGNSLSDFKDSGLTCDINTTLSNLRHVDISKNNIGLVSMLQHLGPTFPNLEVIRAADNFVEMSDNENPFSSFIHLDILDLHGNNIARMPTVLIHNNPSLRDFDLSRNRIQQIPKSFFSNSNYMIKLQLQDNELDDKVWEQIGAIHTLMYLDMSSNRITRINQQIMSNLVELVVLEVANNEITTVPRRVFQNQIRLQELSLARNAIHDLPSESLYGLLCLTRLELQDNELQNIDKDILNNKTALLHLNLSSNVLETLPSLKRLPSLLVLDARNNVLKELPEDMFIGQNNLRNLYLANNQIVSISDKLFISCTSLQEVDLSNNFLEVVHPSMFRDLKVLKLFLNDNRIKTIGKTFAGMPVLQELVLKNNLISDTIQRYMFPKSLEILDLSFNNIEHIRHYAFDGMDKIRIVNLRYNRIQTLSDMSLTVSTGLFAKTGFLIDKNPLQCDCQLLWLRKWTQTPHGPIIANLNTTECSGAYDYPVAPVQTVPEDRFLCQYEELCPLSCRCCDYTACDCKYICPIDCECFRSSDYSSIHYVNCSGQNLTKINPFIPRLATQLDLSGNKLRSISSHTFIGMNNLTHLFVNNSNIQAVGNRSFFGLSRLRFLYLQWNKITTLYRYMFTGLTALEELHLEHNTITSIQPQTFDQLKSLTMLHIHNNDLQKLSGYVSQLVTQVKDLTLYANEWLCDCDLYQSVSDNPAVFSFGACSSVNLGCVNCSVHSLGYSIGIEVYGSVCKHETHSPFENLVKLRDNETFEADNSSFVKNNGQEVFGKSLIKRASDMQLKIFIPVMLASTLIIIVILIVVCRKEFVRCWLFTKFQCKNRQQQVLYDKTRTYDAFISYSPRDELYVIRELALKLERGNPRYRLRVQHRDWAGGCSVPGFIEYSVRSSHRTIMVLSSDYLQETQWLNYVTQCVKQDSIHRLIIIVLGAIDSSKLDPVLQSHLRSDFCIRFGDSWFWEKLFYCLPEPKRSAHETSPLAQPYASSDLARFSSAMMDNQAYEEPMSVTSRPLPTIDEHIPTSHSYDYAGGSEHSSNIYEEIKDISNEDPNTSAYCKPWKQIYMEAQIGPERELLAEVKEV